MAQEQSKTPLDALCLEVLKGLGKTLSQMALYNASHPAVRTMLGEAVRMLDEILAQCGGELVYSIDADKLIANGRIIGTVGQVPGSIALIFSRFRLNSITFRSGVTQEELSALCQLVTQRSGAGKAAAPSQALAEAGVGHIRLNEAIYTKVETETGGPAASLASAGRPGGAGGGEGAAVASKGPPAGAGVPGAPQGPVPLGPASAGPAPAELITIVQQQPLEKAIAALVSCAVHDPTDQVAVMQSVLQRIQEELQARVAEATRQLTEQKNEFQNVAGRAQAVLGGVADGVVVVDEQGKVLMMNPEAEELFDSRLAEMAGKGLPDFVGEEHLLTMAKEILTPKDRQVAKDIEVVADADVKKTLRASTVVVQNEAGQPVGMVAALPDLAKHKELQKVERAFVAHVTHELRAPLSSIRAALEILSEELAGRLEGENQRVMGSALTNTDRLEGLINSILDFSKIEAGQMEVFPKTSNAERIAREAVESLRPWAQKRSVRIELNADGQLPLVEADVERSVQVMVNLLSNAVKFSPKGGAISVRVTPGEGEHKQSVLYSVKDSGPGIPKDKQESIFEKFVQIASGERHVGGTGLGLSIAKALVHLQKGQLWVESEEGQGACFVFTLPEAVAPREEAAVKVALAPPRPWWKKLFGLK